MNDEMKITVNGEERPEPALIGVDLASGPDHTVTVPLNEIPLPSEEDAPAQEEEKGIIDPDDPLNKVSERELRSLMDNVKNAVLAMEEIWKSDQREYDVTASNVKELYKFNEDHVTGLPEGSTIEEAINADSNFDPFNGIYKLTEEDVISIFGEDHKIIGVVHSQTLDRIKTVLGDFVAWSSAMREYKEVVAAYQKLIEMEEEKNIQILQAKTNEETDPEKKQKMQEIIDTYYKRKYLGFLVDEVDDDMKKRIAYTWKDSDKISYWLKRSREKLEHLKISTMCILELSQFEKRYLDEKFHRISNILLVYFLGLVTFSKMDNKDDPGRNKAVCMIFAIDGIIRKISSDEVREKVLANIIAFEEQMLEYIPETTQGAQETATEE